VISSETVQGRDHLYNPLIQSDMQFIKRCHFSNDLDQLLRSFHLLQSFSNADVTAVDRDDKFVDYQLHTLEITYQDFH